MLADKIFKDEGSCRVTMDVYQKEGVGTYRHFMLTDVSYPFALKFTAKIVKREMLYAGVTATTGEYYAVVSGVRFDFHWDQESRLLTATNP